ncbi:MAG: S-adenosylmethionine:tRNA ribosyltransferase-isomerase, partial [Deinococcus sp.]
MSAQGPDAVLERLHFELPPERIAQTGAEPRDSSRLMVVRPHQSEPDGPGLEHRLFHELPGLLKGGDLLVFNESRVIPARVMARKRREGGQGGGRVEVLLLREEPGQAPNVWSAYLKPARRAGPELGLGEEKPVRAEVLG